jgi:hypothetical protein
MLWALDLTRTSAITADEIEEESSTSSRFNNIGNLVAIFDVRNFADSMHYRKSRFSFSANVRFFFEQFLRKDFNVSLEDVGMVYLEVSFGAFWCCRKYYV